MPGPSSIGSEVDAKPRRAMTRLLREKSDELTHVDDPPGGSCGVHGAILVAADVDAVPAAPARVERLAIVHLDEGASAEVVDVDHVEPRIEQADVAADEQRGHWAQACSAGELGHVQIEGGLVLAVRVGTQTIKLLFGVIAHVRDGLDHIPVVGSLRKSDKSLNGPIALDTGRRPDIASPMVGEHRPAAVAAAKREAAAGGQAANLWDRDRRARGCETRVFRRSRWRPGANRACSG